MRPSACRAGRRPKRLAGSCRCLLLCKHREVQALHIQGEAKCRKVTAEATDEIVIASAAADRESAARSVNLKNGAGVIAERSHQAEVVNHLVCDACRAEQVIKRNKAIGALALKQLASTARGSDINQPVASVGRNPV